MRFKWLYDMFRLGRPVERPMTKKEEEDCEMELLDLISRDKDGRRRKVGRFIDEKK